MSRLIFARFREFGECPRDKCAVDEGASKFHFPRPSDGKADVTSTGRDPLPAREISVSLKNTCSMPALTVNGQKREAH